MMFPISLNILSKPILFNTFIFISRENKSFELFQEPSGKYRILKNNFILNLILEKYGKIYIKPRWWLKILKENAELHSCEITIALLILRRPGFLVYSKIQ